MSSLEEAAFGGAERLLGSRFLVVALLPVLLVAGTSGLVALAATGQTPDDALRSWQRYGGAAQIVTSLLVVLGLVALAYVLTLFHPPLLRLLEGYWPHWPVLRALHRWCTRRQRARADDGWELVHTMHDASKQAAALALAARLRSAYPPPRYIEVGCLPTALGNRLRAAEYYPLDRYGLEATAIWPRLRPLLPAEATERIVAARTMLEAMVSLLGLAVLFGVAWPLVLIGTGTFGPLLFLCLVAWPVAWVAYRSALSAGAAYGQEMCVVFDLHRQVLLRHLRLAEAPTPAAERPLWSDLNDFYLRNAPLDRPARGIGDPLAASG